MCELFGMSSSVAVGVKYSLHEFATHGGRLYQNKSGWGIAYHADKDAILIKEPVPASDSPWVRFIESHPIYTTCAIAHVRHATAGSPSFANTHPFIRELGGQRHIFAHNGGLHDIWDALSLDAGTFRPVGETDSEYAFCFVLEQLQSLWQGATEPPSLQKRLDVIAEVAEKLRSLGTANFLYSDGETLFVHAHRRHWEENGQVSEPRPPGLSAIVLNRAELSARGLHLTRSDGVATCVASVPITKDDWTPLPEGAVLALSGGRELARIEP